MNKQAKRLFSLALALLLTAPFAVRASDDPPAAEELAIPLEEVTSVQEEVQTESAESVALPAPMETDTDQDVQETVEGPLSIEEPLTEDSAASEADIAAGEGSAPEESASEEVADAESADPSAEPAVSAEDEEVRDPSETLEEMEAALPRNLPDTWHSAVLAVAGTQLDYTADATGYSRYAHWCALWAADYCAYGKDSRAAWADASAYDTWSADFLAFCLYYAGIPADQLPAWPTAELWAKALLTADGEGEEFTPALGDLVFLDRDDENDPVKLDENGLPVIDDETGEEVLIPTADHIGIVSFVEEDGTLWAIVGDCDGKVQEVRLGDDAIAFAPLPEKPAPAEESETVTVEADGVQAASTEPDASEEPIDAEAIEETAAEEAMFEPAADPWKIDNHVFAPEGYVLLTAADDLDADHIYAYAGTPLYYDEEASQFYSLVPAPADPAGQLAAVEGERTPLTYDADINEDGVLNIADANAIYQMVQNGGDYYTVDQIGVEARLRLNYKTIVDFDSVMNLINGVS